MPYDTNNIFARILRGEIPNQTILENRYVLAFNDLYPKAPVHILIIPKGEYMDIYDFGLKAGAEEKCAIFEAISKIAAEQGLDRDGFRVIANTGENGGQEVPHFHFHLLGGEKLGAMLGA